MCVRPVKADPKHYTVEFENDKVRVLRINYAPGERSVMHGHPDLVAIFLADGAAKFTYPDGKTEDAQMKAGQAMFFPALEHLPENVGNTPIRGILVELK
jgi:quercetin dioxygenase-like cupin family protein